MITNRRGTRMGLSVLMMAGAFLTLGTPSTAAEEGLTLAATSAQVNESGMVTVRGTSACAAGVAAHYGDNVPAKLTIFVNVGWLASQRSASAVADLTGRAAPCFNSNPDLEGVPFPALLDCGTVASPCPWATWMFDGQGQAFYGSGFRPGPVHVDLHSGSQAEPTGFVMIDGVLQLDPDGNLLTINLVGSGSSDVRARPCNSVTGRPSVCDHQPAG